MFENIIAQGAAEQLRSDLRCSRLAPSMLFYGPAASGKGSAALELARALSCESEAAWNCSCPSCARHRHIIHSDLLCLGKRAFSTEIAAARAAFLREPSAPASPMFFIRSVRKLLARFSPVLWEDDSKLSKFRTVLEALEEGLAEFESLSSGIAANSPGGAAPGLPASSGLGLLAGSGPAVPASSAPAAPAGGKIIQALEKSSESLLKNALKLEVDCLSDTIPIAQIRRASFWARISPSGKRKTLLIENAGRMQEGSRNSLLKLLEEPPDTVTIVLVAERRQLIIPTLLSRLRPYRFLKRDREKEEEVVRRVFRDTLLVPGLEGTASLAAYLDSFMPQSHENVQALAAYFIACVARSGAIALRKGGAAQTPDELSALGSYCAGIAETGGFQKARNAGEACQLILEKSAGFENISFSQFIRQNLDLISRAARHTGSKSHSILYNDIWGKYAGEAESAVSIYNQNPALVLEGLYYHLKTAICAQSGNQ